MPRKRPPAPSTTPKLSRRALLAGATAAGAAVVVGVRIAPATKPSPAAKKPRWIGHC